jgi:pimeloyl-ACP methyl ester carboxylesterase
MPSAAGIYYSLFDGGQKDSPPLILLHGAGCNHRIWHPSIRRMAGQRVFALDLPGHGNSTGFGLQSIAAYADQIVEFLASLGLYQAVFVGHAMGGGIALEMAIRHPSHTAGLGLISTGAHLGENLDIMESFSNPLTFNGALHNFQQKAFGASTPRALIEQCLQTIRSTRISVLAADWHACARFDRRASIAEVTCPTWVIVGAEDHLTPIAYAHFLADRIPAARLQVIANASHMVILEQPDRVVQGLQQFLSALSSARRTGSAASGLSANRVQTPSPEFSKTEKPNLNPSDSR